MNAKPHLVMFFYNSAEDIINLQIATSGNDDCIITLTDTSGKIVKVFGLNLVEGSNKVALEVMDEIFIERLLHDQCKNYLTGLFVQCQNL